MLRNEATINSLFGISYISAAFFFVKIYVKGDKSVYVLYTGKCLFVINLLGSGSVLHLRRGIGKSCFNFVYTLVTY